MIIHQLFSPLGDVEGCVTIWFLPSKKSLHIPLSEIGDLSIDDLVAIAPGQTHHYYFGLGLRRPGLPEHRQGRKADVIAMTAVLSDIDLFDPAHPGAHEAKNLPESIDDAEPMILVPGRPEPNILIHSGNGLYSGHLFDRPVFLHSANHRTYFQKAYKAYQAPQIKAANDRGWQMDSTATVQRVWRLPGPPNGKTGKPTGVLFFDADRAVMPCQIGFDLPPEMFVEPDGNTQVVVPENVSPPSTDNHPSMPGPTYGIDKVTGALKNTANKYTASILLALEGKPFAEKGNRDEALQGICATIAWLPQARRLPAEELAEILRPSLTAIAAEPDAKRTVEEELEKAADKIERSQEDWHEQEAERRPQLVGLARALGLDISEEDFDDSEGDTSNEDLLKHGLIVKGDTVYVYDFSKEGYTPPIARKDIQPQARDSWENGPPVFDVTYMTEKGEKLKTAPALIQQYGTVAHDIIGDLMLTDSYFDSRERVFHEAMANFRVREAAYDKWIDHWLHLFAGPHYDKICDWIAGVPQLGEQSSALYLDGASGSGKGLLANGLARLWRKGGPTDLDNVLGQNFNAGIIKCPLLWIDEGAKFGKNDKASAKIRSLIGSSSFELNEKYLATRTVNGCIRMMICANNDQVLCFGDEELGVNDLAAIVGRFLHIYTRQEAADWLKANNTGGKMTREWVAGDLIAKHCLWLRDNRKIDPGKRFLVEGDETVMHRKMLTQGDLNGLIFEWLARYATAPSKIESEYKAQNNAPYTRIGNNKLLINTQGVADGWEMYMPKDTRPKSGRIGRVLSNLSHRTCKLGPRGDRIRFHEIDPELILEWSRTTQIGNTDRIKANLDRDAGLNEQEQEIEPEDKIEKYLH